MQSVGSGRTTLLSIRVFLLPSLCLFVHVALPWFCCLQCFDHIIFSHLIPSHVLLPILNFIYSIFLFLLALYYLRFFIFSIVNCRERLAKTKHACTTHFVLCWSSEVFVPLFLVVLIIKCQLKASSLSLFTLLSPICACDGAKDGVKKRVLAGRKTVFCFGSPVVRSHPSLYSHAIAVSLLCISTSVSFVYSLSHSLSLVACILQSFQTITQFCALFTSILWLSRPFLVYAAPLAHTFSALSGISLAVTSMWDCRKRSCRLNLKHCTLHGGIFVLWWKLDVYIRGNHCDS